MEMAAYVKVILGSTAFAIFWVLTVFPAVPILPIGRTAGSFLGAVLMVLFHVITPDEAYEAIDLPILGLLFGTMVVGVYLEKADMFKYLGKLLLWKSKGAKDLLCRICIVAAVSSALFTNDTACFVLTGFVLKIAREHKLPPHPFLLALASSANIGSSATPIGNPQNLIIAVHGKISFGRFLIGILPAMMMGIFLNAVVLLGMYWKLLSVQKDKEDACGQLKSMENGSKSHDEKLRDQLASNENENYGVPVSAYDSARDSNSSKEDVNTGFCRQKSETVSLLVDTLPAYTSEGKETLATRWKWMLWNSRVYLVTLGMLVSLLAGLDMSWTAITAALSLIVLDFQDARPCLEKVSYTLLIFFCGMFITVNGFYTTGIPSALWDYMEPHSRIDRASGMAVLAAAILLLSNLASNVPTVLLFGVQVAASAAKISSAEEKKAWLILGWVSTVAGNLSLFGSAANLIVCEEADHAPHIGYTLSFWRHLKFGVPSTIIVTTIGLVLIR